MWSSNPFIGRLQRMANGCQSHFGGPGVPVVSVYISGYSVAKLQMSQQSSRAGLNLLLEFRSYIHRLYQTIASSTTIVGCSPVVNYNVKRQKLLPAGQFFIHIVLTSVFFRSVCQPAESKKDVAKKSIESLHSLIVKKKTKTKYPAGCFSKCLPTKLSSPNVFEAVR